MRKNISTLEILAAFFLAVALFACSDGKPEQKTAASVPIPVPTATPAPASSPTPPPPPEIEPLPEERPRGLWVLCEGSQRVLEHPERIPQLIRDAQDLGVSDLFVQVYRGGRAWFHSSKADETPYRKILKETGQDSLAELIAEAHGVGLRVHAWVNVLSLAQNRDAHIIRELGRDVVAVDRRGRSILDYPGLDLPETPSMRMGTPAVWLDPAAPGVAVWLTQTFKEIVLDHPDLDGLHLDYIRYPDTLPFSPGSRFDVGMDFGYGNASRDRFARETGRIAPFRSNSANGNRWDDWRRNQLTNLVKEIRRAGQTVKPDLLISAAVIAYPARAYLSMYQDWRGWLDQGILDFATPMLYTLDDQLLRYEAQANAQGVGGDQVWIGLGTWLFAKHPERALAQIEIVRRSGAHGDALFSWDAIADKPKLREALAAAFKSGNDVATNGARP